MYAIIYYWAVRLTISFLTYCSTEAVESSPISHWCLLFLWLSWGYHVQSPSLKCNSWNKMVPICGCAWPMSHVVCRIIQLFNEHALCGSFQMANIDKSFLITMRIIVDFALFCIVVLSRGNNKVLLFNMIRMLYCHICSNTACCSSYLYPPLCHLSPFSYTLVCNGQCLMWFAG